MIAKETEPFLRNNSAIRMMIEEGNRLKKIYGDDKFLCLSGFRQLACEFNLLRG